MLSSLAIWKIAQYPMSTYTGSIAEVLSNFISNAVFFYYQALTIVVLG